jgi:hypothetical protein
MMKRKTALIAHDNTKDDLNANQDNEKRGFFTIGLLKNLLCNKDNFSRDETFGGLPRINI